MHTFIPNEFCKQKFNLDRECYVGNALTQLFQLTLGKENYDSFIPPQDPIPGNGPGQGVVHDNNGNHLGIVIRS
jgi:hypothetical protein